MPRLHKPTDPPELLSPRVRVQMSVPHVVTHIPTQDGEIWSEEMEVDVEVTAAYPCAVILYAIAQATEKLTETLDLHSTQSALGVSDV